MYRLDKNYGFAHLKKNVFPGFHIESAYQLVIQGMFLLSCLWARVLFHSGASHSFVAASCMNSLSLKVESLERLLHVSYPLGIRVRISQICRD